MVKFFGDGIIQNNTSNISSNNNNDGWERTEEERNYFLTVTYTIIYVQINAQQVS